MNGCRKEVFKYSITPDGHGAVVSLFGISALEESIIKRLFSEIRDSRHHYLILDLTQIQEVSKNFFIDFFLFFLRSTEKPLAVVGIKEEEIPYFLKSEVLESEEIFQNLTEARIVMAPKLLTASTKFLLKAA